MSSPILLVDDDPIQGKVLSSLLSNDFHVLHVDSGEAALIALRQAKFELVLTDYIMPEMNGIDLLTKIKGISDDIPVILLTSANDVTLAFKALNAGADDFILKDPEGEYLDVVVSVVRRSIEKQHLKQQSEQLKNELDQAKSIAYLTLDSLDLGVLVLNDELEIQHCNAFLKKLFNPQSDCLVHGESVLMLALLLSLNGQLESNEDKNEILKLLEEDLIHNYKKLRLVTQSQAVYELTCVDLGSAGYSIVFNDITDHIRTKEKIEFIAHHDPLTKLPNRILFSDRLNQAISRCQRSNTGAAFMLLDLDHFKEVNDSLGHAAGDCLLIQVADKLTSLVRNTDTVARIGGDEFVIILQDIDRQHVEKLARKMINQLGKPIKLENGEATIGISIGCCLIPDHGIAEDDLFKKADSAMYVVKESGRNNVNFFDGYVNQEHED